jgi:hypothetical protein
LRLSQHNLIRMNAEQEDFAYGYGNP